MSFNPYNDLKEKFRAYAAKVEYPKRITMWTYPKARLNEQWSISALYERVAAAKQLGFDVKLYADDEGMRVEYVGKRPDRPWEIQ